MSDGTRPLSLSRLGALAERPTLPLVLLLALAYLLLGRLALLLAIPPGFASSVWPAAGVSLMVLLFGGRRLWPGVLLGSFLVNLPTALQGMGGVELLLSTLVPVAIGSGAALQAVVGAWAIERWVGRDSDLTRTRDILLFLALGGPVSCVVNATVGVAALITGGVIDPVEVAFHWWTWWVGDTIGVLVVVPLALAFVGPPDLTRSDRRWRVGVPLLLAAAAVVTLFVYARAQEWRQLGLEMGQRATSLAHAFEKHTESTLDDLMSLESLFAANESVSRRDFGLFAQRILQRNPTFQALSWNPRVALGERPLFEAAARADGFADYRFTERAAGVLLTAEERAEYVVVHYIEPYAGNEPALGFDIASDPSRREAALRARDTGRPAATAGIRLVQEEAEQTGVLILMPVYADGAQPDSVEERRRSLRGYATAVLRVGDALRAALEGLPLEGFNAMVVDRSTPETETVLASIATDTRANGSARFAWDFANDVGGRVWSLHLTPTPGLLASYRRWYAWLVLAAGLGLISLLGILLLVETGRAAELATLNAKLEDGIERRLRLETQRERLIGELELRNAELERFSYSVSHDLKSPLITIKGYLGLLEKDLGPDRSAEIDARLTHLHLAADHMRELVDDLLDLSRAGQATGPAEAVCLGDAAREVVDLMAGRQLGTGVRIEVQPDMPRVLGHRSQILEVLQNLLDNAIKFTSGCDDPRIEIGATAQKNRVVCHVRDNGIGLDPAHRERIFGLFVRLDPTREGTGIGLALVRRIVEMNGGSVWVESEGEGRGSAFYFTLPAG